jgi:transposase
MVLVGIGGMTTRLAYPTDLTAAEWRTLEPLAPAPAANGRPADYPRDWQRPALPGAHRLCLTAPAPRLAAMAIVYHDFQQWRDDGTWARVHDRLRAKVRRSSGRRARPRVAVPNSQSVKTTQPGRSAGLRCAVLRPASSGTARRDPAGCGSPAVVAPALMRAGSGPRGTARRRSSG